MPDLRISLSQSAVLVAGSKDKWDVAGDKHVGDRVGHCAAEVNVQNHRIDLRIRLDRLYRPFDGGDRPQDN